MLRENHICKVQSQNFIIIEQQHLVENVVPRYNTPNIGVIILPLNGMFKRNLNMMEMFAREAFKLLYSQNKCRKEDFDWSYTLLATYGVAMSNFFLAYDTNTGSMGLYTSSFSLLLELAQKGILKPKKSGTQISEDLQKFQDALVTGQRIKNSFKDGTKLISVRLDPEVFGSTVYFKGTIPKTALDVNKDFIFPLPAVNTAMDFFSNELQNKVLRFREVGDKVRACTKNIQVLSFIYGMDRAKQLSSYLYDARLNEFYVPSLGASRYTAGVTNIKFESVEAIDVLNGIADLDLTEVNINYDLAQNYFCDRIISLNQNQVLDLIRQVYVPELNSSVLEAAINGIYNLQNENNLTILRDALKYDYAYKTFNRDIFAIIKRNPQYFGTLEDYNLYCSKQFIGTKYVNVEIPKTVKDLQNLLYTGAFKILISKRDGGMSTIMVTNNADILKQIYGNNYFGVYESTGFKIKYLIDIFNKQDSSKVYQVKDIINLFASNNLDDLVSKISAKKVTLTRDEILNILSDGSYEVELRKTVIKNPNNVTARSCTAHLDRENQSKDYYKMIDMRCIKEIIQIA